MARAYGHAGKLGRAGKLDSPSPVPGLEVQRPFTPRVTRTGTKSGYAPCTVSISEEQLVRQAIAGDIEALTRLLETHGAPISQGLQISPKWRSMVAQDDVMQVTYLEAFMRICDFVPAGPGTFAAWLRRIADNNLKDAIKELQRAKRPQPERRVEMAFDHAGADQSYVELVQVLSSGGGTPSGAVAAKEAVQFVEDAMSRLPADYQTVIRLYELQGRSIAGVAETIGRSEGSVKMLLARARDHLREALGSRSRFLSS